MHAPLPCMPPPHTPCHAWPLPCMRPPTTHDPLPCMPSAMHAPCHACPPATHDPLPCTSPLWTEFLTHASENITLAQLCCGRYQWYIQLIDTWNQIGQLDDFHGIYWFKIKFSLLLDHRNFEKELNSNIFCFFVQDNLPLWTWRSDGLTRFSFFSTFKLPCKESSQVNLHKRKYETK